MPILTESPARALGAFRLAGTSLLGIAALLASAQVVQTNHGNGDSSLPGELTPSSTDLLQTQLVSATRSASGDEAFYNENGGYPVVLSRLSDGDYGSFGAAGLGDDGEFTVMPNTVNITFTLDTSVNTSGYSLSSIRTFASWDSGRDGQRYEVQYATVSNPTAFLTLHSISAYDNTSFPSSWEYDDDLGYEVEVVDRSISNTAVELTDSVGFLATNVAAIRFVFDGYENSGTAYREFDVMGTATSGGAIPEPSTYAALLGAAALAGAAISRRRKAA